MRSWSSVLFQAFTFASAATIEIEPRDALTSCLKAGNSSVVLTPSTPNYNESAVANWNFRLRYQPAAIVFPNTPKDVQKYVVCGSRSGVPVVARSGGHSYALYGVGGQNGSLVIDLTNMTSISIDRSGIAKIQTGNRLGNIAQKLWEGGKRALPHGTCPYVGVGGHTAFGGYGPYGRVAGLLHDHVTAAEVVLANGTLTTASSTKNPDLFWALRGAGASYGIVTQWTFATLPAPPTVISYTVDYTTAALGPADVAVLMEKWQKIAISAPDELSVICTVGKVFWVPTSGPLYLQYRGTYYGTKASFDTITANWSSILSPGNFTSKINNWYDGIVAISGPLDTNATETRAAMFAKSWFPKAPVTTAQWTNLFNYIGEKGVNDDSYWYIEVDRWGGGVAKLPSDATSFAHRDALLSFQLVTLVLSPPFPADGVPFLNNMLAALEPNVKAAYSNYVDPTLTPAQWKRQYFGSHYKRLSAIKRAVDPHNVFRFPQSIGLPS